MATRSAFLVERKWEQVADHPLVLIPLGSTEQHGPHLPLDTDSAIATAVAQGVAERISAKTFPGDLVIAPTISYSASGEHQGFAGTSSIGQNVLRSLVIELVRSMSLWAGRLVFVNAHGGNVRPLVSAITQMRSEQHDVAWVPCAPVGSDAHAGRTETSLMLHIAPASVDFARAVTGNTLPLRSIHTSLSTSGVKSVSSSGILGDPIGASSGEGEKLLAEMIEDVVQRILRDVVNDSGCLQSLNLLDAISQQ